METELQIVYQYTEMRSIFWEFVLYWTSVSFGLMIASYVAGRSLPTLVIFLIMLLYIAFSVWIGFAFYSNSTMIAALIQDLQNLQPLQSLGAKSIVEVHLSAETSKIPTLTLFFSAGGTFFGTIAFLWYSHLRSVNDGA